MIDNICTSLARNCCCVISGLSDFVGEAIQIWGIYYKLKKPPSQPGLSIIVFCNFLELGGTLE